jgi:predicted transcriptional regulator
MVGMSLRQQVLKRDNYICQNRDSTNRNLETHHLIPKAEGGEDMIENLITFCNLCHKIIEFISRSIHTHSIEYASRPITDFRRVKVAAQRNRYQILKTLVKDNGNKNIEYLSTSLNIKYKTVGFHLDILEEAGLVEGEFDIDENFVTTHYYITKKGLEIFSRFEGLK